MGTMTTKQMFAAILEKLDKLAPKPSYFGFDHPSGGQIVEAPPELAPDPAVVVCPGGCSYDALLKQYGVAELVKILKSNWYYRESWSQPAKDFVKANPQYFPCWGCGL